MLLPESEANNPGRPRLKIFLAGATGAIGRLLVPLLVAEGHEVAGTTRSATRSKQIAAAGARPVVADALDRDAMFAVLRAERPDVVIHQLTDLGGRDFAGNSRRRIEGTRNLVDASLPALSQSRNRQLRREGTRNLVDAALAVGVQRMIAQSIAWIYVPGQGPAHEDEPLDLDAPGSRGRTVAAVQALELAVAEMPVGVVLRYGTLYGPGTWYSSDGSITEQVRRGEFEANDGVTSFLHVADAAQAALQALDWPAGPFNIVDDEPAAGTDWLPLYASLVGAPPPPIKSSAEGWERGASNAKAREFGWRPQYPIWREGFKTALA